MERLKYGEDDEGEHAPRRHHVAREDTSDSVGIKKEKTAIRRFLERDDTGWVVATDEVARQRLSQAFRNYRKGTGFGAPKKGSSSKSDSTKRNNVPSDARSAKEIEDLKRKMTINIRHSSIASIKQPSVLSRPIVNDREASGCFSMAINNCKRHKSDLT